MTKPEILPCPWCNSPADHKGDNFYGCMNANCPASVVVTSIKTWNGTRAPQASEWLPIESAPKDGTKVDLFIAADYNHRLTDCQYFKYGQDGEGWYRNYGENKVNPVIITHWMPLPAPPRISTPTKGGN